MTLYGCMRCGSARIEPRRLVQGPISFEHEHSAAVRCLDCGTTAPPLVFGDEGERERFRRSARGEGRDI